jgi:hypothetical protein
MKRNIIVAAGIALILAFSVKDSRAQNDAPAPAPVPATNQAPGPTITFQNNLNRAPADNPNQPLAPAPVGPNQPAFQRMPPPRFRQPRPLFSRALSDLRAVKMELQRAEGDLGGHKDSAIEACDKATQELMAVMKALPPMPSPVRPGRPAAGTPPSPSPLQTPPPAAAPPAQP